MSIAWNYLDKRSAAMAALKDYRSMKAIPVSYTHLTLPTT